MAAATRTARASRSKVFRAIRAVWPADKPISVRLSCHDWTEGGNTPEDAAIFADMFKQAGADLIDCSSGQVSKEEKPVYGRLFQTPFSDKIRNEISIPTIAVGAISEADHANSIIAAGRADLCAVARPHLADAAWTLHEAAKIGLTDIPWPKQYRTGQEAVRDQPRPRGGTAGGEMSAAMTSRPLSGRHALVTGAGSGIGAAIAAALAQAGASLSLAGRRREPLERIAGTIGASQANVIDGFDVTDAAAIERGLQSARARFGPIDILVNNAGEAPSAPFEKTDADLWSRVIAVDLTGVFLVTQGRSRRPQGHGAECAHHQHRLDRGAQRLRLCLGVLRRQAWRDRTHPLARARAREDRHHRERGLPRLHRHAAAAQVGRRRSSTRPAAARKKRSRPSPAPIRRAGWSRRKKSPTPCLWLASPDSGSINGQAIVVAGGEVMAG